MTKKEAYKLIKAYERDKDSSGSCDNLCTVLDALEPTPPEGQYTPEEVREMVKNSDLDDDE